MAAGRVRAAAWLCFVLLAVTGCDSDRPAADTAPNFADCGLPKVDPDADASLLPRPLLLGGEAELARTEVEQGRVIGALNVPLGVEATFARLKTALDETEFEILQEDNEGFEAELYVGRGKDLGSLQIRGSTCDDAVVIYLNLPEP